MVQISEALKDTVKKYPHIQNVYFTANGNHYFHVHELKVKGSKKSSGQYGWLKLDQQKVGEDGGLPVFKNVAVENPETKITETLSREQVLSEKSK